MQRRTKIAVAIAVAVVTVPGVQAAERLLVLEPERTEIRFTLGATLHQVEGRVRVARGEIRFDPEGGPASGEIVVDATSADTGHPGRDRDMHGKVLESERFGVFVLRPTETRGILAPAGRSAIELRGELEIHGAAHPVSLTAELTVDGATVAGTAAFEVPYVEWGMRDPSKLLLRVKKHVEVEITLVGALSSLPESSP